MVYNLGKYRYKNGKIYKKIFLLFYKRIDNKEYYPRIIGIKKVNALCHIYE